MLPHLFSSRTRIKLLSIFLLHPKNDYYVRELTRLTGEQINSIRRELENLSIIGLLSSKMNNNKKFYCLNHEFLIIDELTSIFKKLSDDRYDIVRGVSEYGSIDMLAMTGSLTSSDAEACELIIAGEISDKNKLKEFLDGLEEKYNKEIRYVIFEKKDFEFRHKCHDKFLTDFFLTGPLVLIDKFKYHW